MKKKTLELNLKSIEDSVAISDGYHTFDELYDHRITLYIALCKSTQNHDETAVEYGGVRPRNRVWRSKFHSDGSNYDGWFIMGINQHQGEQISYHIPNERWNETDFAQTLDKAPEFDGHTSADVLTRIKSL